jgi:hypothetical protein
LGFGGRGFPQLWTAAMASLVTRTNWTRFSICSSVSFGVPLGYRLGASGVVNSSLDEWVKCGPPHDSCPKIHWSSRSPQVYGPHGRYNRYAPSRIKHHHSGEPRVVNFAAPPEHVLSRGRLGQATVGSLMEAWGLR